jgi:hypothetical protein
VDWVLSQLRRQDDPAARDDPWRDLPVWGYRLARPAAGATELPAPRVSLIQAVTAAAQECADAWRDFGLVPGTPLSLVKTGTARGELRTAEQYALVSVRLAPAKTFARDGLSYRLRTVKAAQWPAVAAEIGDKPPGSPAHLAPPNRPGEPGQGQPATFRWASLPHQLKSLADQTGRPALYTSGTHIGRKAGGSVQFPGLRWLRFPVRGTHRSNAIMTAADQAGRQVARYRIAGKGVLTGWRAIDITVHPDQRLSDELILTLALTAPWISSFFASEGGGG